MPTRPHHGQAGADGARTPFRSRDAAPVDRGIVWWSLCVSCPSSRELPAPRLGPRPSCEVLFAVSPLKPGLGSQGSEGACPLFRAEVGGEEAPEEDRGELP